VLHNVN